MGKKKLNRDLALKVLDVVGAVKDALDDLLETMFIIYQPKNYYYEAYGENSYFTVIAMNVASYLWQYSVNDGASWLDFTTGTGYDTPTLTIAVTSTNRTRLRRCKLTDADGNVIYTDVVRAYPKT